MTVGAGRWGLWGWGDGGEGYHTGGDGCLVDCGFNVTADESAEVSVDPGEEAESDPGFYRLAEFHLGGGEVEEPGRVMGLGEGSGFGEGEQKAAGLGKGFRHEHAGHEGVAGEMTGEVWSRGFEVEFGADGCCGGEGNDASDEAKGLTVGQDFIEALVDFIDRVHVGVSGQGQGIGGGVGLGVVLT